jgi:two-component system sensor histidine kinase BaeS
MSPRRAHTRRQLGRGRRRGLAGQLLTGQVLVVAVGSITVAVTAALLAPGLFRRHLARTGTVAPPVRQHAEEAFAAALASALTIATLAALLTAGVTALLLVRRVAAPVEQLAAAADAVASGHYDIAAPDVPFGGELGRLSEAFAHMAARLADTDAARTRLLADLAHELRTPLATMTAYLEAMEDGVVATDEAAWATLRVQVDRLGRLAGDLRSVALAEEQVAMDRWGAVDVTAVTRDAVAVAAPRFAVRGVRLDVVGVGSPAMVLGDGQRLAQIMTNLLDNALRHTRPGGAVSVRVTATARDGRIVVSDDGDGLAPGDLEAVFERFYRVDPSRTSTSGGSGLGLSIARTIARRHGGQLSATSDGIGRGARFTLTLPLAAAAAGSPGATPART